MQYVRTHVKLLDGFRRDQRDASGVRIRATTGLACSLAKQFISTSFHHHPAIHRRSRRLPISLNPAFAYARCPARLYPSVRRNTLCNPSVVKA
jgi:hypothetical protein